MKACHRCFYTSDHPLHLVLDDTGLCSGCRVHEEKDSLDWRPRGEKLGQILDQYRCRSGRNYDCVVPVSGARDSFFIVHTLKRVFGLNPLLVTYNKHYNTDLGIRNLARLRIALDCDIMTLTVDPAKVKAITRTTLRQFGSIYWHCLAGQTVYPVQVAVKFKIPLIVWGAHQGIDQVGMFSHLDEVEMTRKYRKEHDLMGWEAEDLINDFDHVREPDIFPYLYPEDEQIERIGVRGIYLNNYLRWDTKAQHEAMLAIYGYETHAQTRTFDCYNDVDCFNYSDVHDYLKFLKTGYSKVTDHANREIRFRRLSRQTAAKLIRAFRGRPPRHLTQFCEWLGIKASGFKFLSDLWRNPKYWRRDEDWNWQLFNDPLDAATLFDGTSWFRHVKDDCKFKKTRNSRANYPDTKYILIGKGVYSDASPN